MEQLLSNPYKLSSATKSEEIAATKPELFTYKPAQFCNHKLTLFALFFIIFSFYLATAPRSIALEDDGLFLLSSYYLGISHPPGYPLYNLIAHFLISFPWGSVAFKGHAISGLFGALTSITLFWIALGLRFTPKAAIVVSLAFAVSKAFWSQSIITEVYTLNSLLFFLVLHQVLALSFPPGTENQNSNTDKKRLLFLAFLYGLSLTNHWPLMGMATPGLLVLLWPRWRLIVKNIPLALPISLLGLIPPYLWMVLRSQENPPVSFTGSINSWDEFLFFFLRKHFFLFENQMSATIWDTIYYAQSLGWELLMQYTPIGLLLVVYGAGVAWQRLPRQINFGLITLFISTPLILLLSLNVIFTNNGAHSISVTNLIPYGICALWLGMGSMALFEKLQKIKPGSIRKPHLKLGVAGTIIALPLVLHFGVNGRYDYRWVDDYAKFVFSLIEKDGIFFVNGDLHLSALGYLHLVEKVRPDITLITTSGLVFPNRIFKPNRVTDKEKFALVREFVRKTDRPIYFTRRDMKLVAKGYSSTNIGPIYRLEKGKTPSRVIKINKQLLDYLFKIKYSLNHTDHYTRNVSRMVVAHIVESFATVSSTISSEHQKKALTQVLEHFGDSLRVKIFALIGILEGERVEDKVMVEKIMAECREQLKNSRDRKIRALYYLTEGRIYSRWGQHGMAIDSVQASLDSWPDQFNSALAELLTMLKNAGRYEEANSIRQDYIRHAKELSNQL
ncbi:MAG: DUF2723 domain-containing protein [Magnetococcales bacterium]|nr:DUF2723 domain-containing protein [Magnetococcales bacterium]